MHRSYMHRALRLAEKGLGDTAPNPAVGCVIVNDGQIVGQGYHQAAGKPHAEVVALQQAGDAADGSDLYVTLEPCCHYGRTPPCTEAIHAAGVDTIFYACGDPDTRVAGEGHRRLVELGHTVFRGPMEAAARDLNRAYFKHKRTGLPYVTLKMAMTMDGKVATADGSSKWITGDEARREVHRMRGRNQVVMVGSGTATADDPRLTCRIEGRSQCDALIVDTTGRTVPRARVFERDGSTCFIAVSETCDAQSRARLADSGAEVMEVRRGPDGLHLASLMKQFGERDVMSILCEGGPTLAGGLLTEHLVDEIVFFIAPKILGQGLDPVADFGIESLADAREIDVFETRRFGQDLMIRGTICSQD